jgi:hypothetical protein
MGITDTRSGQAALFFMRKNKRARAAVGNLTAWSHPLAVTATHYVQNVGNAYQAQNTGTTGSTPPTHTRGIVSDGVINWLFVDSKLFANAPTPLSP